MALLHRRQASIICLPDGAAAVSYKQMLARLPTCRSAEAPRLMSCLKPPMPHTAPPVSSMQVKVFVP